MRYISTRGGIKPIGFLDTVMMGLATDGGLILPESIPKLDESYVKKLVNLKYLDLCYEVLRLFIDEIDGNELRDLINRSYRRFTHEKIVPLVTLNHISILELFHGPTLAFKDIALQFLGELFEYLLKKLNTQINILGATSGDTGSAAIHGVRGKSGINIFILHPNNRVSLIQELQMTTVIDKNVFNLGINGTFDDCQAIVKKIFNDLDFKNSYKLTAINSINWARVLAQVVYYVWGVTQTILDNKPLPVYFSVPTGNFGDIFAGYIAKRLLGDEFIGKLILATNENDILTRFINTGVYRKGTVIPTTSPSMDIQVASNFERYLYYLFGDPERVNKAFLDFEKTGCIEIDGGELRQVQEEFISYSINQGEVVKIIKKYYEVHNYLLDPHTAVGVGALEKATKEHGLSGTFISLATAHPCKFPEAIKDAIGIDPPTPPHIEALKGLPKRKFVFDPDEGLIKEFISSEIRRISSEKLLSSN